jgi:CheY-like chemotaxis protein
VFAAIIPQNDPRLPLTPPGAEVGVAQVEPLFPSPVESPRALRVLLVEDAPFLRYAFGRLLRLHGFEVLEASDGQEALDRISKFDPHLVLTDLMMPVMNGLELIRRLHADPSTAKLPVVAITADATERAERQARQAGAVDVITKPVDLPALLDRLKVFLIRYDD